MDNRPGCKVADSLGHAVFLDRDGVINRLVWNERTTRYESPHRVEDFALMPGAIGALGGLRQQGFTLFLVSNQPSYALGKTTLEEIGRIHRRFELELARAGVEFREFYYCHHHPRGVVPAYSGPCQCRKPSAFFLHEAERQFGIQLERSWMIGDRDSDVECGRRAGCRTILIACPESQEDRGASKPDYTAENLAAAVHVLESRGLG